MKKTLSVLLVILLLPVIAFAQETDYSWLQDLSINQLKELDAEIHKLIPYEGEIQENKDDSFLIGTWECLIPAAISVSKRDKHYIVTFLEAGSGTISEIDVKDPTMSSSDLSFSYEIKDSGLIETDVGFLKLTYEYGEDEEGPYLVRVGEPEYVHRKTSE